MLQATRNLSTPAHFSSLHLQQQFGAPNSKAARDLVDRLQARRPLTELQQRDELAVEIGFEGQFFLRQAVLQPKLAQNRTESLVW